MKRIVATRKQNRGNRRKNNVFWQEKVIGNKRIKRILNQKAEKRALFDEFQKHTKHKNIHRGDLRATLATMRYDTSNPISAKEARIIGKELGVPKIKLRHLRKEDARELNRKAEYDHRRNGSSSKSNRFNEADAKVIERSTGREHKDNRIHERQQEYVQKNNVREIERRMPIAPRSDRPPQKQRNHLSAIDQINTSHRASHTLSGVDKNDASPTIRRSMGSHRAQAKPLTSADSQGNFNMGASEDLSAKSIEDFSHNFRSADFSHSTPAGNASNDRKAA